MKILHTADWHIGQFKGPVVDGVNLRLQDTVKCLEYMVEVAQKEKPDIVCISGDIFHQEQIGPVRYSDEMIIATDTITKLADIAKGVIVMRGTPNHDGSGQFRVLDRMFAKTSHVHIITAPTVLHTPYTDIACLPGFDKQEFRAKFPGLSADEENLAWTKYISDMVFALRAECEKTPILMAHYTVPGCNMESGQTSFFTNFEPVIPREALMAARYEAVLLGHIHRPQIIEGLVSELDVKIILMALSESVGARLRENGFQCRTVEISIRDNGLYHFTRQCKLDRASNLTEEIARTAFELFQKNYNWEHPIRSLGVRGCDLVSEEMPYQLDLFMDETKREKIKKMDQVVDEIRGRFGYQSIQRAFMYQDKILAQLNAKEHTVHPQAYFHG